jgi:WhiB family redox-sensing transcriptional regulator
VSEELSDEPWMAEGACRGSDVDVFFPPFGGDAASFADRAKAVCRTCPVIHLCLEFALRENERHGVWGGTTPKERRRMRAGLGPMRQLRPCGTLAAYRRGCRCDECRDVNALYQRRKRGTAA